MHQNHIFTKRVRQRFSVISATRMVFKKWTHQLFLLVLTDAQNYSPTISCDVIESLMVCLLLVESYSITNLVGAGGNFVTQKIVRGTVAIKLGLQDKLELGNLDAERDWSHSADMVEGMWLILNHREPRDWLLASGISHSVRDFCEITFSKLGLDYKDYVVVNPKFCRPNELYKLKGDSSETRKVLGWNPKYDFESLVEEMLKGALKEMEKN